MRLFLQSSFIALGLITIAFVAPQFTVSKPELIQASASESVYEVFRFYSENYQSHFYTISQEEKEYIIQNDKNWNYEGVAYSAHVTDQGNTSPLFRFYSENYQSHFYTISQEEKEYIIQNDKNWNYEGIAFYVQAQGSPVYRFYSQQFRSHFYTTSQEERDYLIATDENWSYEGIAFYSEEGISSNDVISHNALFDISELKYEGAFRLEGGEHGISNVNFAVGTLAYNPDRNSLYIAGHAHDNAIGEFLVVPPKTSQKVEDLNVGESISDFRLLAPADGTNRITGMLYQDKQLIVNSEIWYDAPGTNTDTTYVLRDTENFPTAPVDGYFQLEGRARSAGYIAPIPQMWQEKFGSEHLTGWSSVYSIISRYSIGPTLFTFDTDDLTGSQGEVTTQAYMNFPFGDNEQFIDSTALITNNQSASPVWNHLSRGMYGFIVPNSSSFLVLGSSGGIESGIGYKITQDSGRLCGGYCSYNADDNYNYYWLFDLDDILSAENPWDVRPYDYGKLSVPFDNGGSHKIIGATFDPIESRLYVSLSAAGQVGTYDRPPLIITYSISR